MNTAEKKQKILELKQMMQNPGMVSSDVSLASADSPTSYKNDKALSGACTFSDLPQSEKDDAPRDVKIFEDSPEKAYERLLKLLSYSDRCSFDLIKKLSEIGFSQASISEALERAQKANYVNDERFARYYIDAQLRAGKGSRGIEQSLVQKGYEETAVSYLMNDVLDEAEPEAVRARVFLDAHPPRSKNLRDSAFRKLINKGFSVSVASEAARQYAKDVQAEEF